MISRESSEFIVMRDKQGMVFSLVYILWEVDKADNNCIILQSLN